MKTIFAKATDKVSIVGKLDADKMKLFIDAERVAGAPSITKKEILDVLAEFVDLTRVHEGVIDDVAACLSRGEKVGERRIVKGTPPETGADGKVLLLVKKMATAGEVKQDEKGRTDYFELNLFENIRKDQPIARIYPPKNGVDGMDALGNRIASKPGKPVKVSLDKTLTTKPGEDPNHPYELVVSNTEGYLLEESGRLSIQEELHIKGDLDFHFGNVDFIGKVKVSGEVHQGFSIRAKKGIEIAGAFQGGGSLTCPEGDILVKGFVYGGERTKVLCGKDLYLTVARDLFVEARGNVHVAKEASGCTLRTEAAVLSPQGHIFGGECFAVCGAEAKLFGSESGIKTTLRLTSDVETRSEYIQIVTAVQSHEKALQLLELHLGPLLKNPARLQLLKGEHQAKMQKMLAKHKEVDESRIKLVAKQKAALETAHRNDTLRINILGSMYQGTVVYAGDEKYEVVEPIKGPKSLDFNPEEKKFILGELQPLACNVKTDGGATSDNKPENKNIQKEAKKEKKQ